MRSEFEGRITTLLRAAHGAANRLARVTGTDAKGRNMVALRVADAMMVLSTKWEGVSGRRNLCGSGCSEKVYPGFVRRVHEKDFTGTDFGHEFM